MEKEHQVTPAEPTCLPGRRTELVGQQHDRWNRHVMLPNKHTHQLRGKQSGAGPERSLPSNVRGGDFPWRAKNNDPHAQSGTLGKNSDVQRRGFRDSRPLDSAETRSSVPDPRHVESNNPISPATHPAVTSWANVASQAPIKNFQEKLSNDQVPTDKMAAQQLEADVGTAAGRKKRRKKKKCKEVDLRTQAELQDSKVQQEAPKFEDEEEFPGLAPAGNRAEQLTSNRKTGRGNEEKHQDEMEASMGKNAAKTPLAEAAMKGQKSEKTSGKKSKAPVQLDIGNMLSVLENKQHSHKVKQTVISVGGGLPIIHKQTPAQKKAPRQQEKIAHNPLDSTSPLVKKGKQREVPKAKKPTALKKVILKEREERKQRRLQEEMAAPPQNDPLDHATLTDEDVGALQGSDNPQEDETAKGGDGESDRAPLAEKQDLSVSTPDRPKIHSRKFREYCSQMLSKDVDQCVTSLLKELVRFQDRLYQKDPNKARMKRRVVMGLREVLKNLKLRKVKCVIISPNCERVQAKGGLDDALHTIIDTCREQEVPFVFALSRKALGRCVNKVVPVSLVGIFNYDGAQDYYHQMIELTSEARRAYEDMLASIEPAVSDTDLSVERHSTHAEEPEHCQLWKKLLEKESNHKSLNFEAWPSECNDENEVS
ncbi:selenocysteine insertion sequence-binding protein 2-like isoform X2 [Corythoichthys intestinalis]|uniref:selenocysteine insertion sequence-binding protein 2-like isoform X2 n=1 Tax=Corythoichthys intestinalis TaxID=161448 RepID=UPI0025A5CFB3|nr:selenocysteine insertion sequence-binding protein 2-like isoform X2 [Corythoichthys intestinalis]